MASTTHVFVVQRGTALYERYEDKFIGIVGIYATLEDANRAVQVSQREFMKEFGIEEVTGDDDEFVGFCYEDRGGVKDGEASPAGTPVGLFWEFDDGLCWYTCGVECFRVIGSSR
jgi:hypothetical protein